MKFFLDTANVEEIKKYLAWGVVDGVTTNPSIIAKEGADLEQRIKEIAALVDGPISAEVVSTELEGMLEEGRKYAAWHKNVYIKLPMTPNGLMACKKLNDEGYNINMTLIFSASQALLAAKAGAALISPFIGRLDDVGQDGMKLIEEIVYMLGNFDYKAEVLTASVRHPRHVIDAAKLGSHVITMPPDVLGKLIQHPLTDKGLAIFLADWEKLQNNK